MNKLLFIASLLVFPTLLLAGSVANEIEKHPQEASLDPDTPISAEEALKGNLRHENRSGSFAFGGIMFVGNLGTRGPSYNFSFGSGWSMGSRLSLTTGLDVTFDFDSAVFGGSADTQRALAFIAAVKGALNVFILDKDISPVVSAEVGYGLARHGITKSVSGGIVLGICGGVSFFRTFSKHLQILLHFGTFLDSGYASTPFMVGLRIGASF